MVSCPLLPLSVGTDTPGPPKAAKNPSMGHILAFCIEDAGTGGIVNRCCRIEENMLARGRKILRIKQKASTESRCFVFWSG